MRRARFVLALAAVVACNHEDAKSERDHKGRSDPTPQARTPDPVPAVAAPEDTTIHRVPIGSSPAIGGKAPLVTIVEFGDFQCSFCKRVEPTLASLRAKYSDDLRVVWKNQPMPNHDRAKPAAELAMDARATSDAVFWAVHDDLYASASLDDASLAHIASAHGVKQTTAHHKAIDDDQALATSLGVNVTGTPVFFVNGRKLVGAQPEAAFTRIVDAQLADAKTRVAKGTDRAKIYDEIMATAE